MNPNLKKNIATLLAFAIAFAFVESSVVVYLRSLYYPDGFYFPLKVIQPNHLFVELAREVATIVMLAAVGIMTGEHRWKKFSYFIFAFGVWDIFYYLWLKVLLDWPSTLLDWDILFLIPIPWISPVIAPVLISLFLITASILILLKEENGFHPSPLAWLSAIVGSGFILFSFMRDTDATLRLQMPQPYHYELLIAGLAVYCFALFHSLRVKS